MTSRVFVGLSGPTFFDYQHAATKTKNDTSSSPNPILENAFGLILFYDEIWFLCESLCPQSLRGHSKIRYLDRYLEESSHSSLKNKVFDAIQKNSPNETDQSISDVCTKNFGVYWERAATAGAYWWNSGGRRIDNHSHGLDVLGNSLSANSNRLLTLSADLAICSAIERDLGATLSLNSFTRNIFHAIHPTQHHPLIQASGNAMLGSVVINAKISNCTLPIGPHPDLFDRISNSDYARQFRGYIHAKNVEDAHSCYLDVVREIDDSVKQTVKKAANAVHPTRGIASVLVELLHDQIGTGVLKKIGQWYGGQVTPPPIVAAAFLMDVDVSDH